MGLKSFRFFVHVAVHIHCFAGVGNYMYCGIVRNSVAGKCSCKRLLRI